MNRTNRELQGQVRLGQARQAFLDDPQFVQAVEEAKETIFQSWVSTTTLQSSERESLWMQWHSLDLVLMLLRIPIGDAKMAAQEQRGNTYRQKLELM